jgi:RNA polymerase-binding protein DksA
MAQPSASRDARDHTSGEPLSREQVAATLAVAREQAVQDLAQLTGSYDELVAAAHLSNADDEHDPEGATIASERSQLDALVRAAQNRLVEIDAAVGRLDRGSYGVCESCGRPVAAARLEARPVARTCIECAAR